MTANRRRPALDPDAAPFEVPGATVELLGDDRAAVTWPNGRSCVVGGAESDPDAARAAAEAWARARG